MLQLKRPQDFVISSGNNHTIKDFIIMLDTFERSPDPIAGINLPAKKAKMDKLASKKVLQPKLKRTKSKLASPKKGFPL